MIYELKGKILSLGEVVTGTSRSGQPWQRQDVLVEMEDGEYKTPVALVAFNDVVDNIDKLNIGDPVDVRFTISAREYNGRHYNDLRVFSIRNQNGWSGRMINKQEAPAPVPFPSDARKAAAKAKVQAILDGTAPVDDNPEDDLPF